MYNKIFVNKFRLHKINIIITSMFTNLYLFYVKTKKEGLRSLIEINPTSDNTS